MSWIDFADSPASEPHEDFFQLVPPTPQNGQGHGPQETFMAGGGYHLGPDRLKSHRSMSSVGSIDSHMSNWSDLPSEPSSSEDYVDGMGYSHPRLGGVAGNGGVGQHGEGKGGPRGGASLSIDPKLFQTRDREGSVVESEGNMKTAKPAKVVLSPKKASSKKKTSHARKQHPEHIPRPRNAFILFRKHVVDSKLIPPSVEMRHQNVSIITAKMWSEAPPEQKAHFNQLARLEKEEHMKKYPGYRYQPVYRRTNVIRRRVRKDEAEEEKCNEVAELLIKGKSGTELEQEIRDKIGRTSTPLATRSKAASSATGGAASELSKGALRALRAQERRRSSPSLDWTDVGSSRAASLEADAADSGQSTRLGTGVGMGMEVGMAVGGNGYDVGQGDMSYMAEHVPVLFGQEYHWGLDNALDKLPQQIYAYPSVQGEYQPFGTQEAGADMAGAEHQQYTYPQPAASLSGGPSLALGDFYTYDRALPFSPTGASFAAQMGGHQPLAGGAGAAPRTDLVLAGSYPSPTSGVYGSTGMARLPVPMSARWDRAHAMLPPSSEVPLEGLGFEPQDDLLLQEFGAALAQADAEW